MQSLKVQSLKVQSLKVQSLKVLVAMQEVTHAHILTCLQSLGLAQADGVLVHSAIQFLGRPAGGPGVYFDALCSVLGIAVQGSETGSLGTPVPQGTLVVPAFNFAFARGETYDPKSTPSNGMGVFAEYVRQQPCARRTLHPLQSLVAVGLCADDLAQRDTSGAFDPSSAFERLLELDFKLLLLGADIQAVSMLHYSEQRLKVPYRYWKTFSGLVRTSAGWENRTYRMFARDLEMDAHLTLVPVQSVLEQRGQWQAVRLNYGWISTCRLRHLVLAIDEFLSVDPWSLMLNRQSAKEIYDRRPWRRNT